MGPTPEVFTDPEALIEHLQALGTLSSADTSAMTELDHGLQTAARLSRDWPDDVELQIAGLLHDLAHPWDGAGHQLLGARVAELIAGHVEAKRYLVAVTPEYRSRLSADSVATLEAQGGPLAPDEAARFASRPERRALVGLRLADDAAKVPGAVVPGLEEWLAPLRALCERGGRRSP
jgi:predicted HD phosphohydrolase